MIRNGDDFTHAFVSANERYRRLDGPVPLAHVEIGVTHPCTDHLDETLARPKLGWLGDWDVALHHHGLFEAGYDGGELCVWDLVGHGSKRNGGSRGLLSLSVYILVIR